MESAKGVAGYYSDSRYQQAANLLKQCKYEEAIEFFAELLQASEAKYGDLAFETAPAYYEYGNALFAKVEETTDLLGDALKAAQERAKAGAEEVGDDDDPGDDQDDDQGDEENDVEEEEGADETHEELAEKAESSALDTGRPYFVLASEGPCPQVEEPDDDKQLAWEVLEVAKKIYQDYQGPEADVPLSNVFSRLADISRFDGHYREAIRDYTESLRLRQAALPATSRDLADVLYNMGVCHVYLSSEQGEAKRAELREAIAKYTQARDILKKRSEEDSTPNAEKADLRSIVEDLTEELEALEQDLQQEATSSSSSSQLPVTTIGFGSSSGSSQASAPFATSSSNSGTQNSSNGDVMMLQGRSKKKHPELNKTSTSNENDDSEAKRSRV